MLNDGFVTAVEYLNIGLKISLSSLLLSTIPCKVYALVNYLVTVKSGKAMFEVIITSDMPCLFFWEPWNDHRKSHEQ